MKAITVKKALSLIHGRNRIHCTSNFGFAITGWHKDHASAKEAIETADELFLLDEDEAILSHRLLCVKPKGKYPQERVLMQVLEQKDHHIKKEKS